MMADNGLYIVRVDRSIVALNGCAHIRRIVGHYVWGPQK